MDRVNDLSWCGLQDKLGRVGLRASRADSEDIVGSGSRWIRRRVLWADPSTGAVQTLSTRHAAHFSSSSTPFHRIFQQQFVGGVVVGFLGVA